MKDIITLSQEVIDFKIRIAEKVIEEKIAPIVEYFDKQEKKLFDKLYSQLLKEEKEV